jgi:hypothetical protein
MQLRKERLSQVSLDEAIDRVAGPQKREHAKLDDCLSSSVDRIDLMPATMLVARKPMERC